MSCPPSMVHRSGDKLVVRSVVSGDRLYAPSDDDNDTQDPPLDFEDEPVNQLLDDLPQCKVKRNYACSVCSYYTQNPRYFLHHLKNVHQEKIRIYECPNCLYASKHSQKLQRHIHMVHIMGKRKTSVKKKPEEPNASLESPKKESEPEELEMPVEPEESIESYEMTESSLGDETKCSLCSFTSRNPSLVLRHERQMHLKKKFYRCTKCDYITHMKARFTKHVKYHSMPMIKCDMCDFRTPYKWNLDRHNKNHFANGQFKCRLCNFTADIKQSLTVHEMNHHVPPVNHCGPQIGKRRCRVGASDIIEAEKQLASEPVDVDPDDMEMLEMERESFGQVSMADPRCAVTAEEAAQMAAVEISVAQPNVTSNYKGLNVRNPTTAAYLTGNIKAEDVIFTKNGSVYMKKFKCRACPYKAAWESEMIRHEARVHNLEPKKRPAPRPIPNLIPIQSPTKDRSAASDELTEKDVNDLARNCDTSSLKDFASVISGDDVKSEQLKDFMAYFDEGTPEKKDEPKMPEIFKKKNATFFDRLKEKLMTGAGDSGMVCWCGHKSKCLSESAIHQKTHSENASDKGEKTVAPAISGTELSSTRCQHCRQRCKTSSDLYIHLQSCPEMCKKVTETDDNKTNANDIKKETEEKVVNGYQANENMFTEDDRETVDDLDEHQEELNEADRKIFVWNDVQDGKKDVDLSQDDDTPSKSPVADTSLYGYEIAPGFGSVLPTDWETNGESLSKFNIDFANSDATIKKVFRCPQCPFWSTTASRFHVHVVSHVNVKPFGCSACPYQSKWKWDVTKHIRLKRERDPVHESAELRTGDVEFGRRNYAKYRQYVTTMRIHHPMVGHQMTVGEAASKMSAVLIPLTGASETSPPAPPRNSAASITALGKRLHPDGAEPMPKKKAASERKMWKCKKCKFRNPDRNVVLVHVKEHYESQKSTEANNNTVNNLSVYSSNFQNVETELTGTSITPIASGGQLNAFPDNSGRYTIKCNLCEYITDSASAFQDHNRHHVENPNAAYKCNLCPFYSDDKQYMTNHVQSHGANGDEYTQLLQNSGDMENDSIDKQEDLCDDRDMAEISVNRSHNLANRDEQLLEVFKRFKCTFCPYDTNNKSQYLYHRQFHRGRGAFKCNICSYNVSKRHLLHQHLKIHGVRRDEFKKCMDDSVDQEPQEPPLQSAIDTSECADIPLVWVYKNGTLTKMFKCRHCPHVNLRKSNIHEHEKMHGERGLRDTDSGHVATWNRCSECNYMCNNAGALASHFKVHQGFFGQICALADTRRSDESQIKEITRMLRPESNPERTIHKIVAPTVDIPTSDAESHSEHANEAKSAPATERRMPAMATKKVLHFCPVCPGRFLNLKDLENHSRFHGASLPFKCNACTYGARILAHLQAHKKVHMNEYQEKTNMLCVTYETSNDYPRPKTTIADEKSGGQDDKGWVVVHSTPEVHRKPPAKQFSCHKCPASFFKSVALAHHLTLHGGRDPFQCRSCDYRVRTYGNLIKHEAVHGLEPRIKKRNGSAAEMSPTADPEFGMLIHGSPQFVYPTTMKNGKQKGKRYKCHKCPSAFEKREQYKVHLTLHGAKQRYRCEKCDYSVKYFANYTQHMRKHEFNERSLVERRKASVKSDDSDPLSTEVVTEDTCSSQESCSPSRASKSLLQRPMSIVEQQALVLQREKGIAVPEQRHRCYYCPYSHTRRDAVENHEKRHFNAKGTNVCEFCNYTVPQPHFLREHQKLHFEAGNAPDAYMVCEKMELWADTENGKVLLFKDNGSNEPVETRFEPVIPADDNSSFRKMYVNVKTGEEILRQQPESVLEPAEIPPLLEMKDEPVDELSDEEQLVMDERMDHDSTDEQDELDDDEMIVDDREAIDEEEAEVEDDETVAVERDAVDEMEMTVESEITDDVSRIKAEAEEIVDEMEMDTAELDIYEAKMTVKNESEIVDDVTTDNERLVSNESEEKLLIDRMVPMNKVKEENIESVEPDAKVSSVVNNETAIAEEMNVHNQIYDPELEMVKNEPKDDDSSDSSSSSSSCSTSSSSASSSCSSSDSESGKEE